MSPIRPSERGRYPDDWDVISADVRHFRAQGRCECTGECGSARCVAGAPGSTYERCPAVNRQWHPVTGSRVVLTVAHLDHTPENVDPGNLRAFCQLCHLAYDRVHHLQTRAVSAREILGRCAGVGG